MEPVRLGIIGCGVIGTQHLGAALSLPEIKLVAVADLIEERGQKNGAEAGCKIYVEGSDLLKDPDVEAVVLAFPAQHRTELGLAALAAGKHLLTEKPVAMNAGEVRQLIAARGNLIAGACCSRYHFVPHALAATEVIAQGRLGQIRSIHARSIFPAGPRPEKMPPEWRLKKELNGGGILMNWSCYDLDYLLGLTSWTVRPRLVLAQTWEIPEIWRSFIPPGSHADTHFTAFVKCEDNVALSIERAEYSAGHNDNVWQILGDLGSLFLQMSPTEGKELWLEKADPEQGVVKELVYSGDEDWHVTSTGVLADFAAAVREGRQPQTSLERALIVQQISDAIYASSESGKAVAIE
jgi:predicted dehydrogenase